MVQTVDKKEVFIPSPIAQEIIKCLPHVDFSNLQHIVDIGSGSGILATEALECDTSSRIQTVTALDTAPQAIVQSLCSIAEGISQRAQTPFLTVTDPCEINPKKYLQNNSLFIINVPQCPEHLSITDYGSGKGKGNEILLSYLKQISKLVNCQVICPIISYADPNGTNEFIEQNFSTIERSKVVRPTPSYLNVARTFSNGVSPVLTGTTPFLNPLRTSQRPTTQLSVRDSIVLLTNKRK